MYSRVEIQRENAAVTCRENVGYSVLNWHTFMCVSVIVCVWVCERKNKSEKNHEMDSKKKWENKMDKEYERKKYRETFRKIEWNKIEKNIKNNRKLEKKDWR